MSGAQRLSASQRGAYHVLELHRLVEMCSTPFGITEGGHVAGAPPMPPLDKMCCTPFGITEGGIHKSRSSLAERRHVLNAFRHHRGGHVLVFEDRVISRVCSTPFGITEGGHSASVPFAASCPRAQRLSASQRGASPWLDSIANTTWGAQRLSASQRGASRLPVVPADQLKECSTPFGITEGGMRSRN